MKSANGRRDFIRFSLLSSASLLLPKFGLGRPQQLEAQACEVTTSDIQGPFWEPNAPFQTKLASDTEPGEWVIISGKVYYSDCEYPITNATVDVWGADKDGKYAPDKLRGRMLTGTNGEYVVETIYPANYDQGNGQYRPRHLHYKVTAQGFPTLTTQLYFAGDQFIPNDPWASVPAAKNRIIPLTKTDGKWYGTFDIFMNITTGVDEMDQFEGYLRQNFPNPFTNITNINFGVNSDMHAQLCIFDTGGRLVRTLIDQHLARGRYSVQWDGRADNGLNLHPGSYISQLRLNNERAKEINLIKAG